LRAVSSQVDLLSPAAGALKEAVEELSVIVFEDSFVPGTFSASAFRRT
jgi:hypothetical protein